jgi:hypothetical protein
VRRFIVATCGWLVACQAIVGIGDRSEATPDDAGGAPTTDTGSDGPPALDPDAAPPVGCPDGCLPPAPAGWIGPSATYDGADSSKPTDCPASSYTQREIDSHVGMNGLPAVCDCGAVVLLNAKCTASIASFSDPGCTPPGILQGQASSTARCTATLDNNGSHYKVTLQAFNAGSCTFPNATVTLPPPTFSKVELACGLAQPTACGPRADCVTTPAPAAPFTRLCIHKDGNVSCPAQDYSVRFLAYKKITDNRTCTACTATATGGSCGTAWGNQGTMAGCLSPVPPNDKVLGTCYPYPGAGTLVDIGATGPFNVMCPRTGGEPSGTADDGEPVTFCCNQ